ncbi:RNA recognition motif-containing protein 12 [Elsinoe fawcettii]|nr:RNA recognition motif-containing protein 12 [Elsinoe fawcettii]
MSSKLDQSLDEITGGRRSARPNQRRARKSATAAPVGGVGKKTATKPLKATPTGPKAAGKAAATLPARGPSKIIVSNLPDDVNEQQIKEYFSSTVGQVRHVQMNYTKTGKSTGVATIIFAQSNSAAEAAKAYNGVKVDNRPMRIEVIVDAGSVAAPPAPKGLKDRITAPKNAAAAKPKAAGAKPANGTPAAAGEKAGRRQKKPRNARPKKKTAEELDADMADYFEPGAVAPAAATNGAAAAAPAAAAPNGGEAAMEDEIM